MRTQKRGVSAILAVTMALVMLLGTGAAAATVDPDAVFLKMPTAEDLNKVYDGRQPAWVDFDYDISAEATLWIQDESKGEDGSGLVWLDIYRWNAETNAYEPYDVGRYPGNMEGPGFNMDEAGFFNYGPRYGERYFSLKTIYVGKYKAVWLIPIYGTNTENFNTYEYVEYEVEFEITPPGIFNSVPELGRDADGTPVVAPEPDFDLSKIDYAGDADSVEVNTFWYVEDMEQDNRAGEALAQAPSEIGKYVYRIQVTDGELDENLYCPFELTDPDAEMPAIFWQMGDIFVVDQITVPNKVYDGKPVTMADMNITIDPTRIGKVGGDEVWYEYVWYEPNRYGNFTDMIAECQGKTEGPSAPGTYRFQLGVHSDVAGDEFEGHLYILFTISEPEAINFTDVAEADWFFAAVEYNVQNGLFKGVSETSFAPQATTTRSQMATVLYRLAGEPAVTAQEIADVAADAWYAEAVNWAIQNDIMPATEDGFAPDAPVTREAMAYALLGMAKLEDVDTTGSADLSTFSDQDALGAWAAEAMAWAVDAKLFEGKGENQLDPLGNATRAEVATLLMRYCQGVLN